MPRYYSKKNNKRFTSRKNLSRKHKSNNKYLNKKYSNKKGGSLTASLKSLKNFKSLKSLTPILSIIKSDKFNKKKLKKYIYELSKLCFKDAVEFKLNLGEIKEKSLKKELINTKILSYRLLFILYNNGLYEEISECHYSRT